MFGKKAVKDHLRSIDLPYFAVYTGAFAEYVPLMFANVSENNELEIFGEGQDESSFTGIPDVADFVAESTSSEHSLLPVLPFVETHLKLLAALPLEKLANQAIGISGDRSTIKEIAEMRRSKQPEIKITHRSIEDVEEEYKRTQDFILWLKLQYAKGRGRSEGDGQAGREKDFYPGWKPTPLANFL
jgi:hypothetical protein